ncbi:MAG: hypothetical protein CMK59_09390 [Proteobacteria bacterium]|nr:hypothetical protein [Pseudomonadota bacterium]
MRLFFLTRNKGLGVKKLLNSIPVLDESDRVQWDLLISMLILIAAFEIPYDWLVGWKDPVHAAVFNWVFFIFFFLDMILNSLTKRPKKPWFVTEIISDFKYGKKTVEDRVEILHQPTDIAKGYMKSIWFPIDLLSTIPWAFFAELFLPLNSLRMLRLLRLARLFRVLRLTKAVYLLERIRRAVPSVPSVERLFFLFLSIPWLAHLFACFFYAFEKGNSNVSYESSFYFMWMALITQDASGSTTSDAAFWIVMLAVVLSVFVFASVTGNLAAIYTGLDFKKVQRKQVLLRDHTVVIGWNKNIYSMIAELQVPAEGNSNDIVLLSQHEEGTVIRLFEENGVSIDPRRLTIIEGSIYSVQNISLLAIDRAKNVIIIGGEDLEQVYIEQDIKAEEELFRLADIQVLKILLACSQIFNLAQDLRVSRQIRGVLPLVAAVHSEKTAHLLRKGIPSGLNSQNQEQLLSLQVVDTEDVLSRCLVQATLQPELIRVFSEIFSYRHDESLSGGYHSVEIYIIPVGQFKDHESLLERTFADLSIRFTRAILIGFFTFDEQVILEAQNSYGSENQHHLVLNPGYRSSSDGQLIHLKKEQEHRLKKSDALVFIARSRDDAMHQEESVSVQELKNKLVYEKTIKAAQKILLLGTGRKAVNICKLLPHYLPAGSEIHSQVIAEEQLVNNIELKPIFELQNKAEHFDVYSVLKDMGARFHFDARIVVTDSVDRKQHDANILMSLTALYAAEDQSERKESQTIFEIIDQQNEKLAQTFNIGNRKVASLLSTELVSNYLVQLANNPLRGVVYKELLDRSGNEIYLDDVSIYANLWNENASAFPESLCNGGGSLPSFKAMQTLARGLQRIAIGVVGVLYGQNQEKREGQDYIMLCPSKPSFDVLEGLYSTEDWAETKESGSFRTVTHVIAIGPSEL